MQLRAHRLALFAGAGALLVGLVAPVNPAWAAGAPQPATADPYSPAYGHPYRRGAVPTTGQSIRMKSFERSRASTTSSGNPGTLSYAGGIDGIGVTSGTPKVYLVFWGSQWGTQHTDSNGNLTFGNDPDGGAPYIQNLFKGLGTGGETWSGVLTQYCDGPHVAAGASTCGANAAHVGYPMGGALAGVWYDSSSAEPSAATGYQIAKEAIAAAGHFGNTTAASNRFAQYFILSPTGLNPDSYQTAGFCAWHDYNGDGTLDGGGAVYSPFGDIAFTNMPYTMDLGAACGQGIVNNPGTLDGYSIVAGHEYAETLTDQNPAGGWSNNNPQSANYGSENGDECAWITGGQGQMQDVALATGSFAMQSTWSNSNGACEIADPVVANDVVTVVSGSAQSAIIGTAYANPMVVKVTGPSGTPVQGANVTFTAPSSGAAVTFGPCSGGNPQSYACTVTTDSQGVATSSTPTANSVLGSFYVTASSSGLPSQSFSLTNVTGPASVVVVDGGAGQSALAGGSGFANPLTVTVTDPFGHPVPNAPVSFSSPASGPAATFAPCPGGNPSPYQCVVFTDSNGVATSSAITTASVPGTFPVMVSVAGATPAQAVLTNLQNGYYMVGSDGGIFTYGGAPFSGSTGGMTLNKPIVGMAAAPNGGYYLVASDGGIFNFGAPYLGSTGAMHLNAPIVGMAVAPGGGYYLVASDGGIFNFGNAPYLGSTGAIHLNKPIVGMAVAPNGGYYLVASDGGIFNFGAPYMGSTGAIQLNKPIVGMAVDPVTGGYWLLASDGGIFNFGAPFYGSKGGSALNQPMVGMAASAVLPG